MKAPSTSSSMEDIRIISWLLPASFGTNRSMTPPDRETGPGVGFPSRSACRFSLVAGFRFRPFGGTRYNLSLEAGKRWFTGNSKSEPVGRSPDRCVSRFYSALTSIHESSWVGLTLTCDQSDLLPDLGGASAGVSSSPRLGVRSEEHTS